MLITSLQNNRIKAIRSLRMHKYRAREGKYFIEGIRIVEEALDRHAPVETLLHCPELLVSERARALLEQHADIEQLVVSPEVFGSLSGREAPQGIAAVVRSSATSLHEIPLPSDLFVIVAWQLQTPGNLGAIIRTADAAGAHAVVIVEPSVDLYDPDTIRATMGSLYALPIALVRDESDLNTWFAGVRGTGIPLQILGTTAHATRLIWDVDCRGPLALLIGSEKDGLPEHIRSTVDVLARLPMAGSASSLNVSAATAAIVFEVVRQRMTGHAPAT
ncbi:MAG: RNA methyltransferase [Anaerolineae bacterium]